MAATCALASNDYVLAEQIRPEGLIVQMHLSVTCLTGPRKTQTPTNYREKQQNLMGKELNGGSSGRTLTQSCRSITPQRLVKSNHWSTDLKKTPSWGNFIKTPSELTLKSVQRQD